MHVCWQNTPSKLVTISVTTRQEGHASSKTIKLAPTKILQTPVLNRRRRLTQVDLYNGRKTGGRLGCNETKLVAFFFVTVYMRLKELFNK